MQKMLCLDVACLMCALRLHRCCQVGEVCMICVYLVAALFNGLTNLSVSSLHNAENGRWCR